MQSEPEEVGGDASHELDLVTVFRTNSTQGAFEAQAVKALLEASGIEAVLVGSGSLPNLSDRVRVAKHDAEKALAVIAEAESVGSDGATEAERDTE